MQSHLHSVTHFLPVSESSEAKAQKDEHKSSRTDKDDVSTICHDMPYPKPFVTLSNVTINERDPLPLSHAPSPTAPSYSPFDDSASVPDTPSPLYSLSGDHQGMGVNDDDGIEEIDGIEEMHIDLTGSPGSSFHNPITLE